MKAPNESLRLLSALIAAAIVGMLLCLLLSSCTTFNRAANYMDKHPADAAGYCALKFPVTEGFSEFVVDSVLPANNGDYTSRIDSLNEATLRLLAVAKEHCDTVFVSGPVRTVTQKVVQLKQGYKPCDTAKIYYRVTRTVKDGAAADSYRFELVKEQAAHVETAKDKRWWKIACIITWSLIAVFLAGWIIAKSKVV